MPYYSNCCTRCMRFPGNKGGGEEAKGAEAVADKGEEESAIVKRGKEAKDKSAGKGRGVKKDEATDRVKISTCGYCYAVNYCSTECQAAHWPSHEPLCKAFQRLKAEPGARGLLVQRSFPTQRELGLHKLDLLVAVTAAMGRPLQPVEKAVILHQKHCCVCWKTHCLDLYPCPKCLCVSFCKEHRKQALSQHAKACPIFILCLAADLELVSAGASEASTFSLSQPRDVSCLVDTEVEDSENGDDDDDDEDQATEEKQKVEERGGGGGGGGSGGGSDGKAKEIGYTSDENGAVTVMEGDRKAADRSGGGGGDSGNSEAGKMTSSKTKKLKRACTKKLKKDDVSGTDDVDDDDDGEGEGAADDGWMSLRKVKPSKEENHISPADDADSSRVGSSSSSGGGGGDGARSVGGVLSVAEAKNAGRIAESAATGGAGADSTTANTICNNYVAEEGQGGLQQQQEQRDTKEDKQLEAWPEGGTKEEETGKPTTISALTEMTCLVPTSWSSYLTRRQDGALTTVALALMTQDACYPLTLLLLAERIKAKRPKMIDQYSSTGGEQSKKLKLKDRTSLIIHVIWSSAIQDVQLDSRHEEILHQLPHLQRLILLFVGSSLSADLDGQDIKPALCADCVAKGRELVMRFSCRMYYQHVIGMEQADDEQKGENGLQKDESKADENADANDGCNELNDNNTKDRERSRSGSVSALGGGQSRATRTFVPPDMVVAFHAGLFEVIIDAHKEQWTPTLRLLAERRIPCAFTSYNAEECRADEEVWRTVGGKVGLKPFTNPFRSLKPYREVFHVDRFYSWNACLVASDGFRTLPHDDLEYCGPGDAKVDMAFLIHK